MKATKVLKKAIEESLVGQEPSNVRISLVRQEDPFTMVELVFERKGEVIRAGGFSKRMHLDEFSAHRGLQIAAGRAAKSLAYKMWARGFTPYHLKGGKKDA